MSQVPADGYFLASQLRRSILGNIAQASPPFMKQTLSTKLTLALVILAAAIIVVCSVTLFIAWQTSEKTRFLAENLLPNTINSLNMVNKIGVLNSTMLEYTQGELEEQAIYNKNLVDYKSLSQRIIVNDDIAQNWARVLPFSDRLETFAQNHVFGAYNPEAADHARQQIEKAILAIGRPLEAILEELKNEEIADARNTTSLEEAVYDDLPGVQYYLELIDESGDMLTDLDRYLLGDQEAENRFFSDALEFELFLAKLKPLEQRPSEVIRLTEVERLFNQLKVTAESVFSTFDNASLIRAQQSIDRFENTELETLKTLLENISLTASERVRVETNTLNQISEASIQIVIVIIIISVISLILLFVFARHSIFQPLLTVKQNIEALRAGKRDIIFDKITDDELGHIIKSLEEFQQELTELDRLREQNNQQSALLLEEKLRLSQTLEELQSAQTKLIETEKLSSLGRLVAGVAHEVNTPLGVSVTMASTLAENVQQFLKDIRSGQISRQTLDQFESESKETVDVLLNSLDRAAQLIANFKQVANDQTSEQLREFELGQVIEEVYSTLHHKIKNRPIRFHFECDPNLKMHSYPGPIGQIITNLFNNSLLHGFEGRERGSIDIRANLQGHKVRLIYTDDGVGLSEEVMGKIFDPFFTTKLGKGGSGMGMHIVYNLVTRTLGGDITVSSENGATFIITLPMNAPETQNKD